MAPKQDKQEQILQSILETGIAQEKFLKNIFTCINELNTEFKSA